MPLGLHINNLTFLILPLTTTKTLIKPAKFGMERIIWLCKDHNPQIIDLFWNSGDDVMDHNPLTIDLCLSEAPRQPLLLFLIVVDLDQTSALQQIPSKSSLNLIISQKKLIQELLENNH